MAAKRVNGILDKAAFAAGFAAYQAPETGDDARTESWLAGWEAAKRLDGDPLPEGCTLAYVLGYTEAQEGYGWHRNPFGNVVHEGEDQEVYDWDDGWRHSGNGYDMHNCLQHTNERDECTICGEHCPQ